MNTQISMVIVGNPISRGGLQTLLVSGKFPSDEYEQLDTYPTVKEKLTYRIKHAKEYVTYTVKDINVQPVDASRDGILIVSISIPKALRLTGNASPYSLLMEVYNLYVADYMTISSNGTRVFANKQVDKATFEQILNKYDVEQRRGQLYITMSEAGAGGVVCISSDEKLSELFRDSQYPEFREYCHIEIGRACIPTVNIAIPRIQEYSVFLNGEWRKTLTNGEDTFDSATYLRDDEYNTYEGSRVKFSLGELVASENGALYDGRVQLQGSRINCTVKAALKQFNFSVLITPDGKKESIDDTYGKIGPWLEKGKIKVLFGTKDISKDVANGEIVTVWGEDVNNALRVTPNTMDNYTFIVEKDPYKKQIRLRVKTKTEENISFRPIRKPVPSVDISAIRNNADVLKIAFVNNNMADKYDAILYREDEYGHQLYRLRQPLAFHAKGNKYLATISIDSEWADGGNVSVMLKKYDETGVNVSGLSEEQPVFFNNAYAEIDVYSLQFAPVKRERTWKKFVLPVCIALLFFAIGFLIGKNTTLGGDSGQPTQTEQEEIEVQDSIDNPEAQDTYTEYVDTDTKEAENKDGNVSSENPKVSNGMPSTPATQRGIQIPVDYKAKIVEAVNNRDWNALADEGQRKGLLTQAIKIKPSQINISQRNAIEGYWYKLDDSQKAIRDEMLEGKYFNTLEEVVSFYDNELKKAIE